MSSRLAVCVVVTWVVGAFYPLVANAQSIDAEIPVLTIRGTVFLPDGSIAKDAIIEQSNDSQSNDLLSATIAEGHFEIKTNGTKINAAGHLIRTPDWDFQAPIRLSDHTLRRDYLTPMKVTLTPTKVIRVKVTDEDRVVAKCNVQLTTFHVFSYTAKTGPDGIAVIKIPQEETVGHISAWAGNHRIGGTSSLNARDTEFAVEISRSDPVLVRVIDAEQKPVANVRLEIYLSGNNQAGDHRGVWSIPPLFQTTNADGEALFRWIPKWATVHVHPNLIDKSVWRKEKDEDLQTLPDGTYLLKVTPARTKERVLVEGQVGGVTSDVTGLQVILWSLEGGEESHTSDVHFTRCDAKGRFKARVLPDCNYQVYGNDLDLATDFWNGVIVTSNDGKIQAPKPALVKTVPVEIQITQGRDHRPLPDAFLSFEVPDKLSGGRRFWGKPDEQGRFVVHVGEGDLQIGVSCERWNQKKTIKVVEGASNVVALHRKTFDKQMIHGTLVPEERGRDMTPMNIRITGMDENFQETLTVNSDAQGHFSVEIAADVISVLATSSDGEFFGCGIVPVRKDLEIPIYPTVLNEGTVFDPDGQPLPGVSVRMSAKLMDHLGEYPPGAQEHEKRSLKLFEDRVVVTDDKGRFVFAKTPQQVKLSLRFTGSEGSKWESWKEVTMKPGEIPRQTIVRFQSEKQIAESFAASFESLISMALADCRLAGTRVLILIHGRGELANRFISTHIYSRPPQKETYSYIPRTYSIFDSSDQSSRILGQNEFLAAHDWSAPEKNSLFLAVLDQDGKELARGSFNLADSEVATTEVTEFLKTHRPPSRDAMVDFDAAVAEARRTNRRVWVSVSHTRGKHCFRLLSWFQSQGELLSKDYVLFAFDDLRDLNGPELMARLKFEGHGVPYHAILDFDGKELIPSFDPKDIPNNPIASPEAVEQMRKMLETTVQTLTAKELEQLKNSVP